MYDAEIDYTIDRRYLFVGNGTTTGAKDPNFRCLVGEIAGTSGLQIFDDGVEMVYNTDGYTPPGVGEVTILPYSGRLWFNSADAGGTITGNWTNTKRINLT
jgi:hypothetical protein